MVGRKREKEQPALGQTDRPTGEEEKQDGRYIHEVNEPHGRIYNRNMLIYVTKSYLAESVS